MTTRNRYLRQIRYRIVQATGGAAILRETPVDKLTRQQAHAWWDSVTNQWPNNRAANHQAYLRLRAAMSAAFERDMIEANPVNIRDAARRPKKINGGNEYLTNPEEIAAVVAAMPDRYQLLTSLCLHHGLRAGEALGLEQHHLTLVGLDSDHPSGEIKIEQNSQRIEELGKPVYMQLQPPKTKAGYRTVRLHDGAVPLVIHHLENFAPAEEFEMPTHRGLKKVKLLTVTGAGKPVMYTSFLSAFKRAVDKAGADPRLHPHSGRHFVNTTLAEAGVSPAIIGRILGEKDLSTITQVYTHVREGADKDAMEALGKIIMPSIPQQRG